MKVYAIISDYQGYEENVIGIFSTHEKIKEYCKYTFNVRRRLDDDEYSLVEWELDTNKKRKIKIPF